MLPLIRLRHSLFALSVCTVTMCGQQPRGKSTLSDYNAAFLAFGDRVNVSERMEVYPLEGKSFAIPLPFTVGAFAYSPDGEALYGVVSFGHQAKAKTAGLCRIDLHPVRTIPIPGSDIFGIDSLAVSAHQDRIIISGVRKQEGTEQHGIFELNPLNGESRLLVPNNKPKIGNLFPIQSTWSYLAVSPDGRNAVAMRQRVLEVIDLSDGRIRQLSSDLEIGTWSPNGKWLAAIDWKKGHTVLMDAATLTPQRTLLDSNLDWSPDSRYLLGVKKHDFCGPYFATLEAISVETGKAVTISTSHCKVNRATTGWVSAALPR